MDPDYPIDDHKDGCVIYVYANPKASKTKSAGLYGTRLKIQVACPPVDGQANEALLKFIAKTLQTAKSNITLHTGHTQKRKVFYVEGVSAQDAYVGFALKDERSSS